jgi:hypothetical protein
MKLIWLAVPALAVVLTVCGCKTRTEAPSPPPHAALWSTKSTLRLPAWAAPAALPEQRDDDMSTDHDGGGGMRHGASGISWFQGSFEEAFSTSCSCHCYHFGLKP